MELKACGATASLVKSRSLDSKSLDSQTLPALFKRSLSAEELRESFAAACNSQNLT
jgi:hypothetical protein